MQPCLQRHPWGGDRRPRVEPRTRHSHVPAAPSLWERWQAHRQVLQQRREATAAAAGAGAHCAAANCSGPLSSSLQAAGGSPVAFSSSRGPPLAACREAPGRSAWTVTAAAVRRGGRAASRQPAADGLWQQQPGPPRLRQRQQQQQQQQQVVEEEEQDSRVGSEDEGGPLGAYQQQQSAGEDGEWLPEQEQAGSVTAQIASCGTLSELVAVLETISAAEWQQERPQGQQQQQEEEEEDGQEQQQHQQQQGSEEETEQQAGLVQAALAAVASLARHRHTALAPSERASLRSLLLTRLLPALRGNEGRGGPDGAAAALAACACVGIAAADLPRRQLAALIAALGPPFDLRPRTLGAALPALAAMGHSPGRVWLDGAAAALQFHAAEASRFEIAGALSTFAALRHAPRGSAVADLLSRLAGSRQHVSRLGGAELAALITALRVLGYRPSASWLRVFTDACVAKFPKMTAADGAALLRGLLWAGARPGAAWARRFLRGLQRSLPGAAPGPLAELLHFSLVLRLQPPEWWVNGCFSLLRAAAAQGHDGSRSSSRTEASGGTAAGAGDTQTQQPGRPEVPPPRTPGAPSSLTAHQLALAAHALALLPPGSRAAVAHRRWLRESVLALGPGALGLPLRELSYLLYAVGRLRLDAPQPWLRACLEQLHVRLMEQQQQEQQRDREPQPQQEQPPQQPPSPRQQQQQEEGTPVSSGAAPRQQRRRLRPPGSPAPADPAELTAALSLMAHFSGAADAAWVAGALSAVAARCGALSDEALAHALVSCAALGLDASGDAEADTTTTTTSSSGSSSSSSSVGMSPAGMPAADAPASETSCAAAARLRAAMSARLSALRSRRDALGLSRAVRLLQAHARREFPGWYGGLVEEARAALGACADDRGSAPARRLMRGSSGSGGGGGAPPGSRGS